MGFKLKAKIDKAKLKTILERKRKLIYQNIETVLRNEAIPYLISLIMVGYDALAAEMNMLPEDPTVPAYWREDFFEQLMRDFEDSFLVQGNKIIIRLGNKEVFGYTAGGKQAPDDNQPIHWLVFYLEGLVGEWAFISPEVYETLSTSSYNPQWGKFGKGFMISREDYYAHGWQRTIPFEEVRHPFSGFAPVDIFREAIDEFRLRPFIQKALDAAAEGRKL